MLVAALLLTGFQPGPRCGAPCGARPRLPPVVASENGGFLSGLIKGLGEVQVQAKSLTDLPNRTASGAQALVADVVSLPKKAEKQAKLAKIMAQLAALRRAPGLKSFFPTSP